MVPIFPLQNFLFLSLNINIPILNVSKRLWYPYELKSDVLSKIFDPLDVVAFSVGFLVNHFFHPSSLLIFVIQICRIFIHLDPVTPLTGCRQLQDKGTCPPFRFRWLIHWMSTSPFYFLVGFASEEFKKKSL